MNSDLSWIWQLLLAVVFSYTLYLNVLAMVVIRFSIRLTRLQRVGQSVVIWLVPILGAAFVLHLLFIDAPKVMPKAWIPWPFKKLIYGKPRKPNKNRSDRRVSGGYHRH